jgi:DNA-binding NarL/FixJ family response regulator
VNGVNGNCANCNRIGGIAAATRATAMATQAALGELRTLAAQMRLREERPGLLRADHPGAVTAPGTLRGQLTAREVAVLHGIVDGKTNAEIAAELYVSEDTVKTHARRLFYQIGARSRAHAVARAYELGVVQVGKVDHTPPRETT